MMLIKQQWITLGLFLVLVVITVWLSTGHLTWDGMRGATCLPDGCFCEAIRYDDTIRQPSNSWSSLGFVLVGLLIIPHALAHSSIFFGHRSLGVIFSTSLIIVGIGSAFYHASMTFWGQFFDVGGMYLIATFILVYAWMRLFRLSFSWMIGIYALLNTILLLLLYFIPETRRNLFAIVIVAGILFELAYAMRHRNLERIWFNSGMFLFVAAYGIWILDNTGILCDPSSLLQGHALWHLLSAIACALLYRYYISESGE